MTSLNKVISCNAEHLASGLRSGVGMPSASSVPSRWRAAVLLNPLMASGRGGTLRFQPQAGPRGSSLRRRRGFPPPAAAPRNLTSLLEAPKRAKQWVTSLDEKTTLAICFSVLYGTFIAVSLKDGGEMLFDGTVVFFIWAVTLWVLRARPQD
ncbi:hypothetical protein D9Q98_003675 [Chlorella vulgaris]|uniref:Uncharacterized protein n=1 Tax=Chlorella vulgaris TaxID=3077 RepID=A0A9D4TT23_CHLVU|nr:hypothetical protein D9Q98_003675 [Chlorella vulgaris]